MIILDTNIISEVMRPQPEARVIGWLAEQATQALAVTTITIAEIGRGLARLPAGRRREDLEGRFSAFVGQAFAERILSFDRDAARTYGAVALKREEQGLHVDTVDLMIAAIAKNAKAKIATRNIGDFEACGITLINPWETSA